MKDRSTVYVSLLLIIAGAYLLLANLVGPLLHLQWRELWPGILGLAAIAFYLPIVVWWDQRRSLAGLAIPGTLLLANAVIFGYNTVTGDWDSWAYLWALEPVAVGVALYLTWLAGLRHGSLLLGAVIVGSMGLGLFLIFGVLFGSFLARVVAPFVLIALGLWLLARGLWGGVRRRPVPRT